MPIFPYVMYVRCHVNGHGLVERNPEKRTRALGHVPNAQRMLRSMRIARFKRGDDALDDIVIEVKAERCRLVVRAAPGRLHPCMPRTVFSAHLHLPPSCLSVLCCSFASFLQLVVATS